MPGVSVLARELYSEGEAARLLRVPQSTLHYWLEGKKKGGKTYKPVIRPEPTGAKTVTWAEFVEAALLRSYRRDLLVRLPELRVFIDLLREGFGVPYPLATQAPLVSGRTIVYEAQEAAQLPPEFALVALASGQPLLTAASDSFLTRVEWRDGVVGLWRPHDDAESPVRIDPDLRFGRPQVGGISTEAIWENSEAGLSVDEVAEQFGLRPQEVRWALAYETSAAEPLTPAA